MFESNRPGIVRGRPQKRICLSYPQFYRQLGQINGRRLSCFVHMIEPRAEGRNGFANHVKELGIRKIPCEFNSRLG